MNINSTPIMTNVIQKVVYFTSIPSISKIVSSLVYQYKSTIPNNIFNKFHQKNNFIKKNFSYLKQIVKILLILGNYLTAFNSVVSVLCVLDFS